MEEKKLEAKANDPMAITELGIVKEVRRWQLEKA